MNKLFRLTKQGVDELNAELTELTSQRSAVADRIKTAREFGDLAENAEYSSARQEQEKNETRISEIEHILQNAELIKAPRTVRAVQLGSKVKLKGAGDKAKEFQVVGTVEADPLNGKISDESPIGQALLGKEVGDKVEIQTPAETSTYKIVVIA
ncbi:MAG TPA: transcription elongation factor GreA [Candidatus Saccharimonadales bacterium]|nr:transcription elongation factor GreA [Candidatus Saccharimonadales bacterium]